MEGWHGLYYKTGLGSGLFLGRVGSKLLVWAGEASRTLLRPQTADRHCQTVWGFGGVVEQGVSLDEAGGLSLPGRPGSASRPLGGRREEANAAVAHRDVGRGDGSPGTVPVG